MSIQELKDAQAESDKKDAELKAAGFAGSAEKVGAKCFAPCSQYPAPWRFTESSEGICTIYSGRSVVADWLTRSQAKTIVEKANA